MEIRVGPKTSPNEMSQITPSMYEPGARNAPYRRLAGKVQIQRLTHILLFTTSVDAAIPFYTNVLGLKLSDRAGDVLAFFHGVHGSDHHLIALAKSDNGRPGFHHASWIVPSVDQIGIGATSMAEEGYRKSWGTGRHVLGSNYFHYIQDPWGSWWEYACGMDYIPASMDWRSQDHSPDDSFYLWGPEVPPEFVMNSERD
jgi:catechol 2,3-dioxygenase